METIWKLASPVSPALLVLPAALFAFLGLKHFGDSVGTTAADSLSLASPAAIWLKNALFAPALARGGVDNKEDSVYGVSWSTNLHDYGEGTSGQTGAVD